jgi:heme A synthase
MNVIPPLAVKTSLFFLLIFLSGFWLRHSGKPYGVVQFNLHKLIGLAAGIFLAVTVYRVHQRSPLGPAELAVVAVTVLLFVTNVIAGGLLSLTRPVPVALAAIHRIFPYLTVSSAALTLLLLR